MATTSILPPTAALAATAAELTAAAVANGDRAAVNAFNKAALLIEQGAQPTPTTDGYLFPSATRGGTVHRYSTRHHLCSCEAGQRGRICWHAATVLLIEATEARRVEPVAKPRIRVSAADYQRGVARARAELARQAVDALFA